MNQELGTSSALADLSPVSPVVVADQSTESPAGTRPLLCLGEEHNDPSQGMVGATRKRPGFVVLEVTGQDCHDGVARQARITAREVVSA